MKVKTLPCPKCKKPGEVDVNEDEYRAMVSCQLHIQDAMPTTPAPIREQLITGFHPACWDAVFKGEEQ